MGMNHLKVKVLVKLEKKAGIYETLPEYYGKL
jgi:hypothetical protein